MNWREIMLSQPGTLAGIPFAVLERVIEYRLLHSDEVKAAVARTMIDTELRYDGALLTAAVEFLTLDRMLNHHEHDRDVVETYWRLVERPARLGGLHGRCVADGLSQLALAYIAHVVLERPFNRSGEDPEVEIFVGEVFGSSEVAVRPPAHA